MARHQREIDPTGKFMNQKTGTPQGIDPQLVIDDLDHRMKNVLTIMHSLVTQSERRATDVESFATDLRARIEAFAKSHEQLGRSGFDAAPLRELVEIKLRPFDPDARLHMEGPDIDLTATAYTATSMALHELTTNAVKHGALGAPEGQLSVTWRCTDDGALELCWAESHGPSVSEPERKGLGSRIIERVIRDTLKGSAETEFAKNGLQVRIAIPAEHVATGGDAATNAGAATSSPKDAIRLPEEFSVLVVEDNAVIALDIADIMTQIGAVEVETAASVDEARKVLAGMKPDFVLLDVNLGEETSLDFATDLARDDQTFAFMTGADGVSGLPGDLGRRPVLRKPYSDASIRSLLSEMSAAR
jgi:two-component sensor histidine kinase/CheY-like chemotaxis protein